MALKTTARIGDSVHGHYDVSGAEIIGSVQSGSATVKNGGIGIARTDDMIHIPGHYHQLTPSPSDFRSHDWRIIGTGKHRSGGKSIAIDGDGGNDADHDGFQTLPSAASIQATTTNLNCSN